MIYVVTNGKYQDTDITVVTMDLNIAIKMWLDTYKEHSILEPNSIQAWDNNEMIWEYGIYQNDMKITKNTTYEEVFLEIYLTRMV